MASRVKSARQALGDDGQVAAVHPDDPRPGLPLRGGGQGLARCESRVGCEPADDEHLPGLGDMVQRLNGSPDPPWPCCRFGSWGTTSATPRSRALPDELITDLARLHWLFITGAGRSFRLRAAGAEFGDIGRLLRVPLLPVSASKSRTASSSSSSSSWTLRTGASSRPTVSRGASMTCTRCASRSFRKFSWRSRSGSRCTRPRSRASRVENLGAWSAYHLGLQHLYRFNRVDNAAAGDIFQRAVALDPFFRAPTLGCRSSTPTAFMHYATLRRGDRRGAPLRRTRARLARSLPFNFTMGRTYWLEGDLDTSLSWLERSTEISPNYAQGIYARAWTETLAGRALDGRQHVDSRCA